VIAWAVGTFAERVCITSSMTGAVIIHLAAASEAGADLRSGRWAGTGKTECGLHI
jgi:hypothetical protein